ncbi:MAG TPA: hypothetical protein DDW50_04165, partial [Firmicutes bacterium]|nr:hypothetical protein [Bacillota bacterium]
KNKNQQDQQQKKSNQSQNASDKQNKSKNQSGQQHSNSGPQKGQMTKAEAEALLQMMKSQDQSKDPVVSGQEAPPKQDW